MGSQHKLMNGNGKTLLFDHTDTATTDITITSTDLSKISGLGTSSLTSTQIKAGIEKGSALSSLVSTPTQIDGKVIPVDTISLLRARTTTPETVWVSGYHVKNDGAFGSNIFRWNPTSTSTDNDGTIIKLTSIATGRYELQYSGAVNVKWFGAKGDGVTDDSDSFEKALIYSSTLEKLLDLGLLSISLQRNIILIDKNYFGIENGNIIKNILIPYGAYAIKFLRCNNFRIINVSINGNNDGSLDDILAGDYGVKLEGCTNAVIEHSSFKMFKDSALTIESEEFTNTESSNILVSKNIFDNVYQTSTTQNGATLIKYINNTFTNMGGAPKFSTRDARAVMEFTNNSVSNATEGVRASGYTHIKISNNEINNTINGVFAETSPLSATPQNIDLIEICSNYIKNSKSAIYVKNNVSLDGGSSPIQNIIIDHNTIIDVSGTDTDDASIYITGNEINNITISNNSIKNISRIAIQITPKCTSSSTLRLLNNTINTSTDLINNSVSINPVSGVFISAVIENNIIINAGGSLFKNISNFIIRGHQEFGKTTQTVVENATYGAVIDSTFISNPSILGIRLLNASYTTIDNTKISSDGAFAIRTEASCSNIREYNNVITGVKSLFILPIGTFYGSGAPTIYAGIGSIYNRTDGGTGTTLYIKESSSGNSGWVAK